MPTNFSAKLKILRKKHNYTQAKLSEELGISKSTISMYENGNREPDFETLELIADFFNVDMNYLTGIEKSETTSLSQLDKEIISLFNRLSAEKKKQVSDFIKFLEDK